MAIALQEEETALAEAVRGFVARYASPVHTRAHLDEWTTNATPEGWGDFVKQGFATVHLPEPHGGGQILDLAVVLEESARGLLPGPLLPTALTSAILSRHGGDAALLDRFAEGAVAATATSTTGLAASRDGDGFQISGSSQAILGAPAAELLLLGASSEAGDVWFLLEPGQSSGVTLEPATPVDLTRPIGIVRLDNVAVPASAVVAVSTEEVRALAAALFAAEAVGIANWCLQSASEYAKLREQFGRSIGSFQSIKHKLAKMFIQVQVMSAAAWDAARAFSESPEQIQLAAAEAAISCLPAAADLALETMTLFGGIGYTWEHDTHLYWRRAMTLNALLGPIDTWQRELGNRSRKAARDFAIILEDEPAGYRDGIATTLAKAAKLPEADQWAFLAAERLVLPHYPAPYGRAATAVEQVVIAQEYERSGVVQPKTIVGEWALPTILSHGTEEQKNTFVPATLQGDIVWCQLFSEPGAGSDLAALTTKAEPVDGGWKLTGQKIWTSMAAKADWGICLARTDTSVPKHKGISYFLVDMRSPGLQIRPLREANGNYLFNEVFLDEVFVPTDRLVGDVNNGWRLARTTLSNERVSIAGVTSRLPLVEWAARTDLVTSDADVARGLGALTAKGYALAAMGLRDVLRRISGLQPGAEGSALKVAASLHAVDTTLEGMKWLGPAAATADGVGGSASMAYLSTPPLLIGGGTLEIQLNVIGERILGLPRD
jgi:alkylation response protein AidB-like acyl-CoA dehydrogenase